MDKHDLEMLRNLERIRNISMDLVQKMKRESKPVVHEQKSTSKVIQFTHSTFTPDKFEFNKFKPDKFKVDKFKGF